MKKERRKIGRGLVSEFNIELTEYKSESLVESVLLVYPGYREAVVGSWCL